jgi:hypothetical protein
MKTGRSNADCFYVSLMTPIYMVTKGLLARLQIRPGMEEKVEHILRNAQSSPNFNTTEMVWFALKFGRNDYGIFSAFTEESGRDAYLTCTVANALKAHGHLLLSVPQIQTVDVLAAKLPDGPLSVGNTKGILLTFQARKGHHREVEQFLRSARPLVMEEKDTTAWFAICIEGGEYGIFDVFPGNTGRLKHLIGHVPRRLVTRSLSLMGSVPDMDMVGIVAENV